jgi:hypothetical protein
VGLPSRQFMMLFMILSSLGKRHHPSTNNMLYAHRNSK